MPPELLIDDNNFQQHLQPPSGQDMGLVPRDYAVQPYGSLYYAKPFDMPLVPRNEWKDRLQERIARKAQLSDLRLISGPNGGPIPSRDQNGKGYCFVAGTPVTMADGSQRPIERIAVGDMVQTREGAPRKVLHTMKRLYTGIMIGLNVREVEGPLVCTADHLIQMGTRGWVAASEFQRGDWAIKPNGDGSYRWQEVYAVKRLQETAIEVFDFEVEEAHHFIANGIVVHNCWAHSGVSAHLLIRAFMGEPYADLSAYAIACMIKGFRDEGGWGGDGVQFQADKGCPTSAFWPQQSMSRANDNPKTWENAALHKYVEWMDGEQGNIDQLVTALLSDCAGIFDYNWWSHSVCGADLVDVDASGSVDSLQVRIWNSWGDSWSDKGMGILKGRKALPDAMLFCRAVRPSAV